jgi:hypothetical protein
VTSRLGTGKSVIFFYSVGLTTASSRPNKLCKFRAGSFAALAKKGSALVRIELTIANLTCQTERRKIKREEMGGVRVDATR